LAALQGSELIIHAGDVGAPEILERLRAVAPVVAVRGNIDVDRWASRLPLTALVEARSARIYVIHDAHDLAIDPAAEGFGLVVSGHSHKAARMERDGVLYLSPGSAGPRRFRLPVTIARLDLATEPWSVEFVDVIPGPP
jgi:putative phosphoesterase